MIKKSKENKRTAKEVVGKVLHELRMHKKVYVISLILGALLSMIIVSLMSYALIGKVYLSEILGCVVGAFVTFITNLLIYAFVDEM